MSVSGIFRSFVSRSGSLLLGSRLQTRSGRSSFCLGPLPGKVAPCDRADALEFVSKRTGGRTLANHCRPAGRVRIPRCRRPRCWLRQRPTSAPGTSAASRTLVRGWCRWRVWRPPIAGRVTWDIHKIGTVSGRFRTEGSLGAHLRLSHVLRSPDRRSTTSELSRKFGSRDRI